MKTTIEVFAFSLLQDSESYSFSNDPDIYLHLKKQFTKYIDKSNGDIPAEKRVIRIPKAIEKKPFWGSNDDNRAIYGIIESGLYGKKYDIVDKSNNKDNIFSTTKGSAIMKPFFYYLKVPRNNDKALLILERTDNDGLYTVFSTILTSMLRDTYGKGKFTIKKTSVITKEYLKELDEGVYKSISMSVDSLPKDTTEKYFSEALISQDFSIELTVKFKNARWNQKKIKQLVESNSNIFLSKDINDILENSERKVTTTLGSSKKTRTYHLNKENRELIRPYYDIDVEENDKGFSKYESIINEISTFIKENDEFKIFK